MKEIMEAHFRELDEAAKTKSHKIAWCTSVGPAELLKGMGFQVFFPGKPRRHARRYPHGYGSHPGCERHGIFAGYLLVPDQ